jgi:hypothetical protein
MIGDKFTEEELKLLKTILNYPKLDTNEITVGKDDAEFDLCESLHRDGVLAKFDTKKRTNPLTWIYGMHSEWVIRIHQMRLKELEAEVERLRLKLHKARE